MRLLRNISLVGCGALGVASALAWALSYRASFGIAVYSRDNARTAMLWTGFPDRSILKPDPFTTTTDVGVYKGYIVIQHSTVDLCGWGGSTAQYEILGFRYMERGWPNRGPAHRSISAPIWVFLMVMMVYPIVRLARIGLLRRRMRLTRGQCLNCGYDLRGNVSRVCPKCGSST